MRSLPARLGNLYLNISFQRIEHPSKEGDLQGPWFLLLQWNGFWQKLRSQGSLTPWNEAPQAHHKLVFVKPKWFWHLRCSGDGLCRHCVVAGDPSLAWADVEDLKQGCRRL